MYIQRLNKLREEKEYSQQFVAEKLNVNRSTYANWEVSFHYYMMYPYRIF